MAFVCYDVEYILASGGPVVITPLPSGIAIKKDWICCMTVVQKLIEDYLYE